MSVQAMAWVLEHSTAKGTDRLVLLSLANHAGKEPVNGAWEAWPGVATIAREAGLDRTRTVQESLARLEAQGAIQRLINGAPDHRIRVDRRPNLYRIHGVTPSVTPALEGAERHDAPAHPATPERGDVPASNGVTPRDRTGCREASPKPSMNRQGTAPLDAGSLYEASDAIRRARDAQALQEAEDSDPMTIEEARRLARQYVKGEQGSVVPVASQDAHQVAAARGVR
jgi:hypothetical protein